MNSTGVHKKTTNKMRHCLVLILLFPVSDMTLSLEIPCKVNLEEGVEYHKITWYKVSTDSGSLKGLVMKDFRKNTTTLYKNANNSYVIGENLSLQNVPNPTSTTCEMFICSVWPPVGHRILQNNYTLPQGCVTAAVNVPRHETQALTSSMNHFSNEHQPLIITAVCLIAVCCILGGVCLYRQRKTYVKVLV